MPDDASWIDKVVVPDDLRELQADIDAYHREQRLAARRQRWARVTTSAAYRRLAFPVATALGALALAAVALVVLTLDRPSARPARLPAPLAASPVAPSGSLRGLLPDVTVTTSHGPAAIRAVRPAVVALVPARCACPRLLDDLAGQAAEGALPLVVVAPAAVDADAAALPGRLHRGLVDVVYDADAVLAHTYSASGVTVLLVAPDGTVPFLQRDVTGGVRLEGPMQEMLAPVASVSAG